MLYVYVTLTPRPPTVFSPSTTLSLSKILTLKEQANTFRFITPQNCHSSNQEKLWIKLHSSVGQHGKAAPGEVVLGFVPAL